MTRRTVKKIIALLCLIALVSLIILIVPKRFNSVDWKNANYYKNCDRYRMSLSLKNILLNSDGKMSYSELVNLLGKPKSSNINVVRENNDVPDLIMIYNIGRKCVFKFDMYDMYITLRNNGDVVSVTFVPN